MPRLKTTIVDSKSYFVIPDELRELYMPSPFLNTPLNTEGNYKVKKDEEGELCLHFDSWTVVGSNKPKRKKKNSARRQVPRQIFVPRFIEGFECGHWEYLPRKLPNSFLNRMEEEAWILFEKERDDRNSKRRAWLTHHHLVEHTSQLACSK